MGTIVRKGKTTKKTDFDVAKYVNSETGELLTSELSGNKMSVTVTEKGDYVVMTSDDYIVLDSQAVSYLVNTLSRTEFSSMMAMTVDLKTPLNIVFNGPTPHTNETLQKYLGYSSKAMFLKLIGKLMKVGVLYQIKGNIQGEVRVIYMMNPFLARKRKTVDNKVIEVFRSFF
jgi:hypothetical protein